MILSETDWHFTSQQESGHGDRLLVPPEHLYTVKTDSLQLDRHGCLIITITSATGPDIKINMKRYNFPAILLLKNFCS